MSGFGAWWRTLAGVAAAPVGNMTRARSPRQVERGIPWLRRIVSHGCCYPSWPSLLASAGVFAVTTLRLGRPVPGPEPTPGLPKRNYRPRIPIDSSG